MVLEIIFYTSVHAIIGFLFINPFVKGNHLLVIQALFSLPGSYERMKQTSDSVFAFLERKTPSFTYRTSSIE